LEPAPELIVANHLNEVLRLTPDDAPDEVMALVKVLKKSKAWADYCEAERSPLEAIARLRKPEVLRRAA
jgi:hypothetical protein